MSIPANETFLANIGWKNGTLDHQEPFNFYPWNEWSPAGNSSQPVNLTILPDNIAALQFLTTGGFKTDYQTFGAKFALARTILSANYYSEAITCVYPISSSYDFLTRVLFYLLLFFALLYRRHTWVAVTALGTAMTYSATTAVHALALLTQFKWRTGPSNMESSQAYGDPDIWGTYPILLAALVMMTPILNWSTNVRRDKAQIIMVLWGMLSFAALVPVMIYVSTHPGGGDLHPWSPNTIGALVLCPLSVVEVNPVCTSPLNFTMETYTTCQCFDFCGLVGPAAPMRSGASMVPWLESQVSEDSYNNKTYKFINYWSRVLAAVIVCYGALGLLHNQFSLHEMRTLIFRLFYTQPKETRVLWNLTRRKNDLSNLVDYSIEDATTGRRKAQFLFAKIAATLYYLLGILIAFICPVIFLFVIVTGEISMFQYAYNEHNDAVGAWSSWVGAAFVIVVAIILRYQDACEHFLLRCGKKALRVLGFDALAEKTKGETMRRTDNRSIFTENVSKFCVHFFGCSIGGVFISLKLAFQEFRDWVKAPPPHAQMCGCEGCVSYRKLVRNTSTITDHADMCTCDQCDSFKEQVGIAVQDHKKLCGCRLCSLKREQSHWKRHRKNLRVCSYCADKHEAALAGTNSPANSVDYEKRGYQTLGMRILQSFDKRILDILESVDSLPTNAASHTLKRYSPQSASI